MIKPIGKRVLIKPSEAQVKTAVGVYIPEGEVMRPMQGQVVDFGTDLAGSGLNIGTVVYYPRYTGAEVEIDGVKYIIIEYTDLLGYDI